MHATSLIVINKITYFVNNNEGGCMHDRGSAMKYCIMGAGDGYLTLPPLGIGNIVKTLQDSSHPSLRGKFGNL